MTERGIDKLWYGRGGRWLAWPLLPLTLVFWAISSLRRACYRAGWLPSRHPGVPVVVVGNLTVGGSGKTPLVIWLAQELSKRGRQVGVVARGYGGRVSAPTLLPPNADAEEFGDEPTLIQAMTGLPVAIGADRAAAAAVLRRSAGVDVILSDDGLQHYRLRRDLEIAVVDGERGFGNGWLLPAGPLRESAARLREVSAIVRRDASIAGAARTAALPQAIPAFDVSLILTGLRSLVPGATELTTLADWRGRHVHAVAAIGRPERFFAALRAHGLEPIEHTARDHHRWSAAELDFGDRLPVLMTAKDAVKCRAFARAGWYCVDAELRFAADGAERLVAWAMRRLGAAA